MSKQINTVCFVSSYNKIYGKVKLYKPDNFRDVIWEYGVYPRKSRIKKEHYNLYIWSIK